MVIASFEYEDNFGSLSVTTHFDSKHVISCTKHDDESFRLGGTALNEVAIYEGVILSLPKATFRAFAPNGRIIEGNGTLSPECWSEADLHSYIHEYYPLDMEGKPHSWFIASRPLENAHHIFVNLDILDGAHNVIKRYRVSPFTGEYIVMEHIHG